MPFTVIVEWSWSCSERDMEHGLLFIYIHIYLRACVCGWTGQYVRMTQDTLQYVFTIWLDLSLDNFSRPGVQIWVELWNGAIRGWWLPWSWFADPLSGIYFQTPCWLGTMFGQHGTQHHFCCCWGSIDLFGAGDDQVVQYSIEMIFLAVDVKWQQAARDYKCVGGMLFPAFCFAYWSGELGIPRVFQWFLVRVGERKTGLTMAKTMASKGTNILKQCKHGQI